MPVEAPEGSLSPIQRQPSLSPERSDAGPSKRPRNTVADQHRRQVEKLLAKPEREIAINVGTKEKTLRAPREMMKNVQGSSAGAGSGEFHVYKQSRRREYERLKIMNDKARAEEEQAAFQARQAERDALADAKTAKNRAKRQKRKQGNKGKGDATATSNPGLAKPNGEMNENGKRKLAGGATVTFKKPGEESDDDDDDEDGEGNDDVVGPIPLPTSIPELSNQEMPKAVEERRITIVDED
ncbi:uncharacterized protein I303_108373 [Kwoniella dejecticola CBS 10117]|uniref:DUF1168-domain-containing protein n=1 Tax=Kwoniella dejecticola CBS 10117 TaxID=1296121 RepID=A0A1A5ZXK8_9TREE|nr:uncharacterized protein I303_07300 [Kwoniella dejecticola CBS 10117]OBR82540.1 hypothetical protein I303_07300 [Kwoniella dejecticola CBS 10117]